LVIGCDLLPNHDGMMLSVSNKNAILCDLPNKNCSTAASTTFDHYATEVVALGERIFAVGGTDPTSDIVEEYFFANNTWIVMNAKLQIGRRNMGSVAVPAQWFSSRPGGCKGIV
jgi:hypothetical protein